MKQSRTTRRNFLQKSAAATAAGASIAYFPWSEKAFANLAATDRPRIGCVGVGSMGSGDAKEHAGFGDILAVCDVDSGRAEAAKNDSGIGKGKAEAYGDYRKLLERNDLDVISVVTTDPWHVKVAIEALQSGRHVFCQKPLTLTLEENQLIRNACKKYSDKVFLVGTQQRSDRDKFLRAVNMVHKGLLGDITKVTIGINGGDVGRTRSKKSDPPKELNWDLWLGQTPRVDYIKQRCHYEFRWWHAYSGGKLTDWGAPRRYAPPGPCSKTSRDKGRSRSTAPTPSTPCRSKTVIPRSMTATTHRRILPSSASSPTAPRWSSTVAARTACCSKVPRDASSSAAARLPASRSKKAGTRTSTPRKTSTGCTKASPFEATSRTSIAASARRQYNGLEHVFSHVQAIDTCHLTAIAARLGRVIKWDPAAEKIVGDDQAQAFFARKPRPGFEIPRV